MTTPRRGEVYSLPVLVRSKGGRREDHPVIVVQTDEATLHLSTVLIVPMTTAKPGQYKTVRRVMRASNPFLREDSWALCHLVQVHEKRAFQGLGAIGALSEDDMVSIEVALRFTLGLV